MAIRKFNGKEIEWLMGNDEDNPFSGVVQTTPVEGTCDGYQMKEVIVKHPDGKLYRFTYCYDSEHGITPTTERPEQEFEAVEVQAVPTTTYKYVPVS